MPWFLLSPFSLTVLSVGFLLFLLTYFLAQNREKSPATRAMIGFLSGVCVVFASFFVIFSSLDPGVSTRAWWVLHLFVLAAVAMVQFAYHFPENRHPEEGRRALGVCLVPALLVYPAYVLHTFSLEPLFSFEGFLFVYLDTPEVGVVIGLEILWVLAVFFRKARLFEAEARGHPVGPIAVLLPTDPRARLIRDLMLVFCSPLVLIVAILMAYQGALSWAVVAHILGTGLMIAAFVLAVLYINNCTEPSTFMLKLVGISLGSILIVFGWGANLAIGVHEAGYDREHRVRGEQALDAEVDGRPGEVPGEVAWIVEWAAGAREPRVLRVPEELREALGGLEARPDASAGRRGYRALSRLDARRFFVTYMVERGERRLEVAFPYLDYRRALHRTCSDLLLILAATVAAVLLVFPAFFRLTLLRPVRALLEGVDEVNEGNLDARVPVRVEDEIGYLSRSFNRMVSSVQEARRDLQESLDYQVELTDAYSCFFPREFLDFLEKRSVTEIRLGDAVELEMTVLFSDIRAFTDMSERMSPAENFRFINDYLGRVGPVVRERGGFIDKFIGDAVMALFPTAAGDAVAAAVGMQRAVEEYDRELVADGREPISIGIGLHTGRLMLGTIGEERRMEGTVISDTVNLASRLEGLTKLYGASVVISEATRAALGADAAFETRPLDRVQVKGKAEAVLVHEVLDGVDEARANRRRETRAAFEEALEACWRGDLEEAATGFRRVRDMDPEDEAAALHLRRIEELVRVGLPEGWDGVATLTAK